MLKMTFESRKVTLSDLRGGGGSSSNCTSHEHCAVTFKLSH